uniref:COG complex component COG2 C-terminal domain-containing protein n=1 Tax=Manihot esculenta TaxID=3983 RepID=A0A2C9UIZ8_MANES
MEKRIQSASLILDASLGHCFVNGLEHQGENAIYNCLHAHAAIDNTKSAKEIFRSTIVAPLVRKIIPHEPSGIVDGKAGCILPGRPTEFLMNYKSSLEFLAHLEGYCPSRSAVAKFQAEVVYAEFMKRWNIGVYFSLRFQEIAGALDSALAATILVPAQNSHSGHGKLQDLTLKQNAVLLESLRSCWREDALIISCSDKFLHLSLQLLARFSSWLFSGLAARKTSNAGSNSAYEWVLSAVPDDFVYIIHGITCLATEVCGDYLDHVLQCLSSCSADTLDLDLRLVKGITATYRMTNKPLPIRYSPYVSGVLRPLKAFSDGERAMTYLTKESRNELLLGGATDTTSRHYEWAAELVSVARKTESSLERIRQGAQRRAGASSDVSDQSVSDTDKICMQLLLDVQQEQVISFIMGNHLGGIVVSMLAIQ